MDKGLELRLQAKLAAIVVHADEATSSGAHHFDGVALRQLIDDPEVVAWIKSLGPLAPAKRAAEAVKRLNSGDGSDL